MLQKSIQLFILLALYLSFGCQEDNDQILRSTVHTFNEVWNTGNYELLSKSVHPEYLKYEGDQKIEGITALSDYIKEFRASIDDVTITYLEEI